jgi:hypothetical protein
MKNSPFTIKHILDNGAVNLWAASWVESVPVEVEGGAQRGVASLTRRLNFASNDDVICSIDNGVVYVMNETGKTVDTYHLPINK